VTVEEAARRWTDAWTSSWRAKDVSLLAPVYADDAIFRSHPFRDPQSPLDYATWAYSDEEGDPELWFGDAVVSDDCAVVEWWAALVENGEPVSLAGASFLRFDDEGRVVDQHDYWNSTPGRVPPWDGWPTSTR
jgi:ketosteroid isomerase-like protein